LLDLVLKGKVANQKLQHQQMMLSTYQDLPVYLVWNMDFRSRTYSQGYMLNAQGDKMTKGSLVPVNEKVYTERGLYWEVINIANLHGDDKLSFEERFEKYNVSIEELKSRRETAESPLEYANAVESLENARLGKPTSSAVHMDASNQALQLYAVLTGDKQTASLCNLANGTDRADAYQILADGLNEAFGLEAKA